MDVDWPALRAAAVQMTERAYAPYSRLHVGAAGVTSDGRMVTGCNVENASYGLTLCAAAARSAGQSTSMAPLRVITITAAAAARPGTISHGTGSGRP